MIIHKMNADFYMITAPQKQKINLNELNLIASGTEEIFIRVSLHSENNKHILTYPVDQKRTVYALRPALTFSDLLSLLQAYVCLYRTIYKYRLKYNNVIWDNRQIVRDEHGIHFVYLPFEERLSKEETKRILIDQISSLKSRDERVQQLLKEIKASASEGECLDVLGQFIDHNSSKPEIDAFAETEGGDSEAETSFLSREEETSFLTAEAETSILSQSDSTFIASEAETSVLTPYPEIPAQPDVKASSTLKDAAAEGFPSTTINSCEEARNQEDPAEEMTSYMPDNFSEGETTLLTESPIQAFTASIKQDVNETLYLLRCNTGERIPITGSFFLVGKDAVNMDYAVNNNTVSRHHATITFESGAYYIMDNKSTNGTTIEGVQLQPFEKVKLYDGALISMGTEYFQVQTERG